MRDRERRGPDLYIARILGIKVFLGPSWFFVALLLTVFYAADVAAYVPGLGARSYVVSFGFALLLYGSVLLHELGHSLVARRFRLPVRRIVLHAFVGLSEITEEPPTPLREALVAAAGPVVSAATAVAAAVAVPVLPPASVPRFLAGGLAVTNAVIAVLNLLPGLPLDGGRVLRALVWRISRDPLRATRVAAWCGRGVGVAVALGGVLLSYGRGGTVGVVNVAVALLIGVFIWSGATAALRGARVRGVLPSLRARTLTRRALPVAADLPLAEALRRLGEDRARALVVVDASGTPTGIVNEAAVSTVPDPRRPWVTVGSLARGLAPGMRIGADLAGPDLLDALRRAPAAEYLVLEPDGRVLGVLANSDVADAISAAGVR